MASMPRSSAREASEGVPLARFRCADGERKVLALGTLDELRLVDRRSGASLADVDEREVEPSVPSMEEGRAVAADHARLSEELGRSAMREVWW